MSNSADSPKILISDTAVPDIFMVGYMQDLSKEAICMYLRLLAEGSDRDFGKDMLVSISGFSTEVTDCSITELVKADLLCTKNNKTFFIVDIKQREVDEYCRYVAAKGIDGNGLELKADDGQRNSLASSINKSHYAGKMSYVFYRLVDTCLYEYEFEPMVVYGLFNEGERRKILMSPRLMKDLAYQWKTDGITTQAKLNEILERDRHVEELVKLMGKLSRRRLNGVDIERITRWVDTFDISIEMADYAFRCNEFRGNITLKDVEEKLIQWLEADIKNYDQAVIFEKENEKINKSKATRRKGKTNVYRTGAEMKALERQGEPGSIIKSEDAGVINQISGDTGSADGDGNDLLRMFGD